MRSDSIVSRYTYTSISHSDDRRTTVFTPLGLSTWSIFEILEVIFFKAAFEYAVAFQFYKCQGALFHDAPFYGRVYVVTRAET
jgi:hypothetical protein